jgi:hypothetical protein
MTDTATDPRVDAYIESMPEGQQNICRTVRALVHAADPEVPETIRGEALEEPRRVGRAVQGCDKSQRYDRGDAGN